MTDKQVAVEKARIKRLLAKWVTVFEMEQWEMKYSYPREYCEEEPDTIAHTFGRWQYRHGTITFFLPVTSSKSVGSLERTIIHELLHVLLLPMSQNLNEGHEHENEYTTVSLQRVIAKAYLQGTRENRKR